MAAPTMLSGYGHRLTVLDATTLALQVLDRLWISRDEGRSWRESVIAGEAGTLINLSAIGGGVLALDYGHRETTPGCGILYCVQTFIDRRYVSPDGGLTWHRLPV